MAGQGVTLGERLLEARFLVSARLRERVSQERMAQLVSELTREPLHKTQWNRYESNTSEPTLAVIRAAAQLSGLTPAYLAFGEAQLIDPVRDRKLSEAEEDRALVAEREEEARAARPKLVPKKKRGRAG